MWPSAARAQPQLELDWEAPAGCPQAGAVRARVRALVGESTTPLHLRAQGRVVRLADGRYRLTLRLDEGDGIGDRTIDSTSCADLSGAAAVALGLWLQRAPNDATRANPNAPNGRSADDGRSPRSTTGGADTSASGGASSTGGASSPASGASSDQPPAAAKDAVNRPRRADASPAETPDAPPAAAANPRLWRVFLRAPAGTLEVLRLPTPSVGLGADLGLRYADWRFGAGARIFQHQTLWSPRVADIGAKLERVTAHVWTCRRLRGGDFELGPCVSLGLERLTVSGVGARVTSRSRQATSLTLGGGGSAYYYPADWMALVGTATLSLASARPRVSIGGVDELRQLGPVVVGVGLASEWIF